MNQQRVKGKENRQCRPAGLLVVAAFVFFVDDWLGKFFHRNTLQHIGMAGLLRHFDILEDALAKIGLLGTAVVSLFVDGFFLLVVVAIAENVFLEPFVLVEVTVRPIHEARGGLVVEHVRDRGMLRGDLMQLQPLGKIFVANTGHATVSHGAPLVNRRRRENQVFSKQLVDVRDAQLF